MMERAKKLNNLQIELLKIFSFQISDEQVKDIQKMLTDYFARQVTAEMDTLFEANSWGEEKIEEWSKEHMRTKYEEK